MGIFASFKSLLLGTRGESSLQQEALDAEQFIYIKIPGAIGPIDRGEIFEEKIDTVLAKEGLGAVSGGGSSLSDPRPDGSRIIEFCGIDIETTDRDRALVVLRELLPTLAAPSGTELHYTTDGRMLQDEYTEGGWRLQQSRTFVHPGFNV